MCRFWLVCEAREQLQVVYTALGMYQLPRMYHLLRIDALTAG